MPTFRSLKRIVIPSRTYRFLRFLEQFLTPTPSREKARGFGGFYAINLFANPGVKRTGIFGFANEFMNPRVRRYGFFKLLSQFMRPEPPRRGLMGVVTAFLDAPVYRLQESRDVVRPRQRDANFLQKFISGINEFLNAYTHFADLFAHRNVVLEVPSDAFRDALEKLVMASRLRIERLTERLLEGSITPREYHVRMMAEVRRINLAAGLLGVRGLGNVTPEAVTKINQQIASELARLTRFLADSYGPNFQQPLDLQRITERQFRAYALRFASAGRAASTVAQSELLNNLYGAATAVGGRMYHRRVVTGDDRSCDDCVEWAAVGWVAVDGGQTLPPPATECVCQQNCRCLMEWCIAVSAGNCPEEYG